MAQITFTIPDELASQVDAERERMQTALHMRFSQSQILSGLIRRALESPQENQVQPSRAG